MAADGTDKQPLKDAATGALSGDASPVCRLLEGLGTMDQRLGVLRQLQAAESSVPFPREFATLDLESKDLADNGKQLNLYAWAPKHEAQLLSDKFDSRGNLTESTCGLPVPVADAQKVQDQNQDKTV